MGGFELITWKEWATAVFYIAVGSATAAAGPTRLAAFVGGLLAGVTIAGVVSIAATRAGGSA